MVLAIIVLLGGFISLAYVIRRRVELARAVGLLLGLVILTCAVWVLLMWPFAYYILTAQRDRLSR